MAAGGKKWLKYMLKVALANAGAVINKDNFYLIIFQCAINTDLTRTLFFKAMHHSILGKVSNNLADRARVAVHFNLLRAIDYYADIARAPHQAQAF